MASRPGIERIARLLGENLTPDIYEPEPVQPNPLHVIEDHGVSLVLTQLAERVYSTLDEFEDPQAAAIAERYAEALQEAAVALEQLEAAYMKQM